MKAIYDSEIRDWLRANPLSDDQELDVYGVPALLFDLTDTDNRFKQLNREIKELPVQQQKLLHYLARNLDPALIIESMEYASPELFWLDKAILIKKVDPTARQHDVLQVFEVNEKLLNEILNVSDVMDREAEKVKKHKIRNWSLVSIPVILILVWLFVYPLLVKPDPVALYEKFKGAYQPDLALIDTISYSGGSYHEAILLMQEGDFTQSATLFAELIPIDSLYRVPSRWFLALINMRNGNAAACKEQLKAIQTDDPVFYKRVAEALWGKIK